MIAFNGGYDIESRVNGDLRQHSNTRLMRMNVGDLLYELSRGITLEPGDIIATGTPAGVGQGFDPPRFLRKGDGKVNDSFYYYREQASLQAHQYQRALDDLAKAIELNPKELLYRAELAAPFACPK